MSYPNFIEEKKLWKQGFKAVVGLDEVGRGPLAGPVVAAAVIANLKFENLNLKSNISLKSINDSKKVSKKKRQELYEFLTSHSHVKWGIGIVSEKLIDRMNILEATKLAMRRALNNMAYKWPILDKSRQLFLLIDGNFTIKFGASQRAIVKGDTKVFSISAASIIAKVTRDKIMERAHLKFPQYGFLQHKGYPTALHVEKLKAFGPCPIHRKTFFPVSVLSKPFLSDGMEN
jgi:ribonuclease HII